jgi:hypothetical protein
LISSIDHLKKNISTELDKNNELKDKLDKITELSKNLSDIIKSSKKS